MSPAPKDHPNLTRSGKGRPPVDGKVKLTCSVLLSTKEWLQREGRNQAGAKIDLLVAEAIAREAEKDLK